MQDSPNERNRTLLTPKPTSLNATIQNAQPPETLPSLSHEPFSLGLYSVNAAEEDAKSNIFVISNTTSPGTRRTEREFFGDGALSPVKPDNRDCSSPMFNLDIESPAMRFKSPRLPEVKEEEAVEASMAGEPSKEKEPEDAEKA